MQRTPAHSADTAFHSPEKPSMSRHDNILQTIGNTPLVRLNRLAPEGVDVYVKVESFNPLGSVKDRMAAPSSRTPSGAACCKPGQTVVEATSGNTGIGLAMVCAQKGYPLVLTMAESFSVERRKLLRFLGARVVLTPAAREGHRHAQQGGRARRASTAGSSAASSRTRPTPTCTPARRRARSSPTSKASGSTPSSRASAPAARCSASARGLKAADPAHPRSSPPSPTTRRCSAAASPSRATPAAGRARAIRSSVRT